MKDRPLSIFVFCAIFILMPAVLPGIDLSHVKAQELSPDVVTTMKARVVEVVSQEVKIVPGTDVKDTYQSLRVLILDGKEKGQMISVDNDYLNLKKGEIFYLTHTIGALDGMNMYSVSDPYRLPWIYGFIGLFVICVLIFGGKQGMRGLVALAASFFFIAYLLLPGILHGYSPIVLSIAISSLIIILGSYITHGFNKVTTSAVIGMVATIVVTGLLAYVAVHGARLTGFANEEAVYLNLDTRGSIDFAGLLMGGILIGLLGVLYDAAIGQAVAVDELHHVGPHISRGVIWKRAIRIGREHIGALVNTLAIAYVGASLPLLLLFYQSSANFSLTINGEIFATEIIRAMIGSIGLVLAVPVTTAIAVFMLIKKTEASPEDQPLIAGELKKVEKAEHRH